MATQLSRTFSAGGNQRKFTISFWVKRTKLSYQCALWGSGGSGNYASSMFFSSDDTLRMWNYFNGSYAGRKYSSAKYRDTNGWYHIVARVDTANSTASERMRVYVNGEEMDYGGQNDNPSQNQTFEIGHTGAHYIGGYGTGAEAELLMSHYHYCDGQSYAPTEFGETDSTTGEWKIKTSPSVSYGTSGSFILKDGNSVTDQSGLSNNWTVANGTLTKTEDNPSNVFNTLNPNHQSTFHSTSRATLANGNTKWTASSNNTGQNAILSTLGMSKGKWYMEVKWKGTDDSQLGVAKDDFGMMTAGSGGFQSAGWYGMITNVSNTGGSGMAWWSNNSATGDRGNTISTNDIIMMAIDITNSKLYFGKNGTWEESGDPTSGSTGTGATSTLASNTTYLVGCSNYGYGVANSWEFNFGNGYFGTTAVATNSGNGYAGAEGSSIFNYQPPTGYSALSTKGLNL